MTGEMNGVDHAVNETWTLHGETVDPLKEGGEKVLALVGAWEVAVADFYEGGSKLEPMRFDFQNAGIFATASTEGLIGPKVGAVVEGRTDGFEAFTFLRAQGVPRDPAELTAGDGKEAVQLFRPGAKGEGEPALFPPAELTGKEGETLLRRKSAEAIDEWFRGGEAILVGVGVGVRGDECIRQHIFKVRESFGVAKVLPKAEAKLLGAGEPGCRRFAAGGGKESEDEVQVVSGKGKIGMAVLLLGGIEVPTSELTFGGVPSQSADGAKERFHARRCA